jgi:hypothetical protein
MVEEVDHCERRDHAHRGREGHQDGIVLVEEASVGLEHDGLPAHREGMGSGDTVPRTA